VSREKEYELIKKCANGDRKAQKMLYENYARVMYGVCLRYCSDKEEAKDILQEGFIKVYNKINQFAFNGSFEGWMKRVFVNTALEYYRVNKIHMYHSDADAANENPHHDYTVERMSQKEILEVMNGLAPGYRMVLNLFIVEGYGHAEIAEMMGISEGTSKSQLSRARIILQKELNKLMMHKLGHEQ
jgi:RNA polymerase sigma factor (sigma-70 family)